MHKNNGGQMIIQQEDEVEVHVQNEQAFDRASHTQLAQNQIITFNQNYLDGESQIPSGENSSAGRRPIPHFNDDV